MAGCFVGYTLPLMDEQETNRRWTGKRDEQKEGYKEIRCSITKGRKQEKGSEYKSGGLMKIVNKRDDNEYPKTVNY